MASTKEAAPSVAVPTAAALDASPQSATAELTKADTKREAEIAAFLDEFAYNDHRRRVLRAAIENGEEVAGKPYFQARLKKLRGD